MPLLSLLDGGIFGAEGALLGLPSLATATVSQSDESATVLVIGGFGISKLKSQQPALLQQLVTAAFGQQQTLTSLLARRSALWRGGGWPGPCWEPLTSTTAAHRRNENPYLTL